MRKSLLIKEPPVVPDLKEGVVYAGRKFTACGEEVYETDIWKDGELRIRHFTYTTGWQNYNFKSDIWDSSSLSWIDFGGRSYCTADSDLSCQYEDKSYKELFEDSSSTHWTLMNMESCARIERQDRAEDRKQLRIDGMMEKSVPPIHRNFKRFISSRMIGRRTAFVKDGRLFCGSCGENIRERQKEKAGDMVTCPHCKKKLVIDTRRKEIKWTRGLQMFQECLDGEYVERQFDVTYFSAAGFKETIKITEMARGFTKFPGGLWDKWYYGKRKGYFGEDQHFWDRKNRSCVGNLRKRFTLYDSNLGDLPLEEYTITTIRALQEYREELDWSWVIRRSSDHTFEAVVKSGIRGLALQKAKGEDPQLPQGCTFTKLHEILCITRQQLRTIREIDGTFISVMALQDFKKITKEELIILEKYAKGYYGKDILYTLKKKDIPITHVATLLEKTEKVNPKNLQIYKDYLDMAEARGCNIRDEIIYRNKRWKEYHDRYVEEDRIRREQEEYKRQKKYIYQKNHKFAGITKDYERNTEIFGFICGDYEFMVPKKAADIIDEGHMQHNCVGASDNYLSKMALRESFIVFMRKTESPDKSFYTIEINEKKILQAYGAYNRKDDWDKVEPVIRKWHRVVKKRMKKLGVTA